MVTQAFVVHRKEYTPKIIATQSQLHPNKFYTLKSTQKLFPLQKNSTIV